MTELQKEPQKFFYANGLEIAITPFDCNLKFLRQSVPAADKPNPGAVPVIRQQNQVIPETQESLSVAVSPVLAKVLLSALYNAVNHYESTNGEISLPQEFVEMYNESFNKTTK